MKQDIILKRSGILNRIKLVSAFSIIFSVIAFSVQAQELITASNYFNGISDYYGDVLDYEAGIVITQGSGDDAVVSEGTIFYKTPNLLRIDFTEPEGQVITVNEENLGIYLPAQAVVMTQQLKRHNDSTLASMASSQGLTLLKKGYSIGYLEGPEPVPLDEGSGEMVTKLKLVWRTTDQGFRQIEMSIGENKLIRRMVALTADMEEIQFDFIDIRINQNIPDARFEFESPPSAYEIKNFLFEPEV
jgi:outer membrane lipoprotein-sorting protein